LTGRNNKENGKKKRKEVMKRNKEVKIEKK
jgi:hypothetical protein